MKKLILTLGIGILTISSGFGQSSPAGANALDATATIGNGFRLYGSNNYKIHLGWSPPTYNYGPVDNWAIKTNMYNATGRGWVWGPINAEPVAAISIGGDMQLKGNFLTESKVGIGMLYPTLPAVELDVNGEINARHGHGDWMKFYNTGNTGFWRIHNPNTEDHLIIGYEENSVATYPVYIHKDGNVGIGTSKITDNFKLSVDGKIRATEIEVSLSSGWADYVFADDYKLDPLVEVEKFIKVNNHLPNVPSAIEVAENGVNLGEMDAILLRKIEELTLYIIELEKKVEKNTSK